MAKCTFCKKTTDALTTIDEEKNVRICRVCAERFQGNNFPIAKARGCNYTFLTIHYCPECGKILVICLQGEDRSMFPYNEGHLSWDKGKPKLPEIVCQNCEIKKQAA